MRSLRLVAAVLTLTLLAAACSDDGNEDGEDPSLPPTTQPASPTSSGPSLVTTPTLPTDEVTTATIEPPPTSSTTTTTTVPAVGTAPPPAPANLECLATTREGEILVEFDALANPDGLASVRPYLGADGGPMINQGFRPISEVDTDREGGARWAVTVKSVPAGVPLVLAVGSFNLLGQESGWWQISTVYNGPGQSCGADVQPLLPPATCTAGCDEEEGEPAA